MGIVAPFSTPARRGRRRAFRLSAAGPTSICAAAFVLVVILAAILAPVVAPFSPTVAVPAARLLSIGTPGHILGTDGQGRDILSRLIWGARPALLAGVVPVAAGGFIGLVVGIIAGLGPRMVNTIIMRVLDILYAFPAVLLAIAISAALGPGLRNAIISLAVIQIPSVARLVESEVVSMRSSDYMVAAKTTGASWVRIATGQVIPVVIAPVLVYLTSFVGLAIVYAAGLSYLGLGVVPPQADWGVMLNDLQQELFVNPSLVLPPAMAIVLVSIAFNLLGDGLRRLLNVQERLR